ncbi:F-box/LRR-repeat protein At3g58980 [Arabidopsis lyrata subsp. lyrata]|uniref:F-box/LRR-repeat protein At3g58980 n=1 Tax=Arabidopsis lyrata subsp. lyrata TaxID=81972 RepID=UPI000A29A397|nr:F-box/LRR-repeat protein At3g58980 [Arabidopsis lyrata subsp. lyrata]|eukprot:XP_020880101.1 F-box/LRR-repeat protein At3g58980 [Arabidopsis lyrata subsp. lyrata]
MRNRIFPFGKRGWVLCFFPKRHRLCDLFLMLKMGILCLLRFQELKLTDEDDHITSNLTNLIKGLRNVEIMNLLSHYSLEMFPKIH